MPVQPPGVWGIDLGQCGLKAIRLQEIDGEIVATAFDYVDIENVLSQPDADPDQLTGEALDKFLCASTLRGDVVAISVPGQSGPAALVKLPPVEEKKIADIVKFEAKQQIPFNLEEVVWDYQKIGSGIVTDGFAMETEIGLFAMKRDMVSRYLQHFKDVGVDIHLVQMAPLALCNFVAFDLLNKGAREPGEEGSDQKNCIVALDIGADSSNLVITDGERIIWQRPIPLGGNHFTRALTKDLKLTFAKAEHVKRNATKSPDLKKILAALKPVLNDFVGEVQRSLGYFTNTHRDADIEYMIGLGNAFRLPGLQKFLSEKLQLEVRKLVKMERVSGDQVVTQQVYTENVLTFAVAYGLALQGLKRARLLTNLLPGEIRVERLVKAKKPFAVAAAAALLLAVGGLALSYAMEYRTYGDKRVTDAMKLSDTASDKAEKAAKAFEAARKKAEAEEAAVKTIVAGQFERDNWLQLYKYINTAIPQPNAEQKRAFLVPTEDDEEGDEPEVIPIADIPDEFKKRYWLDKPNHAGGMSGQKAYEEMLRRQIAEATGKDTGPASSGDDLPAGIEDLIQFNIESVDTFFCRNLSGYWDQVKSARRLKTGAANMVRPVSDFNKAPDGSGWIIEIQGYTYHHEEATFVRNTLLENLARLGIQKPQPEENAGGATPPPGPPGGPKPPAPGAAAPMAPPARGGQPGIGGPPPSGPETLPDMGPVINHISHVVLYEYEPSAAKGPFELLGRKVHDQVRGMALAPPASAEGPGGGQGGGMMGMMGGASPPPGGGMMGMGGSSPPPGGGMMGGMGGGAPPPGDEKPTAPSADSWTPLGSQGAAAVGGPGGGAPRMPGMPTPGGRGPVPAGGSNRPGGLRTPAGPGPMGPMGPGADAGKPAPNTEGGPKRTEFVILLVWKEPTPSDALRGQAAGEPTGGTKAGTASSDTPRSRPQRSRSGRGGRGGRKKGG